MTEQDFQAALSDGWSARVETWPSPTEAHPERVVYQVTASHPIFGEVTIGPKLRLVQRDVDTLRGLIADILAPKLTFSQWLASGERFGYSAAPTGNPMSRLLRLLAVYIDRGDIEPSAMMRVFVASESEVDQLLLDVSDFGIDTNELHWLVELAREKYMAAAMSYEVDDE